MNARAKIPDGHLEKSLRSRPSQRSAPTLVTVTMVSMLMPRRSRSLRRRGPKVSFSDIRTPPRSKDRAEQYQTGFLRFIENGYARAFIFVMCGTGLITF